jgi:hypothetical protein
MRRPSTGWTIEVLNGSWLSVWGRYNPRLAARRLRPPAWVRVAGALPVIQRPAQVVGSLLPGHESAVNSCVLASSGTWLHRDGDPADVVKAR